MIFLRELTEASFLMGPFVDSTDGVTAKTALTMNQNVIRLSKNGGSFAGKNASDSAVHQEGGYYSFNLSVTDLNTVGNLRVAAVTTATLPVWMEVMVIASPVYDSLILGSDRLQVDVEEIGADMITSTVIAANAIGASQIATDAITAAKIAADAIGASELAADAVDEIVQAVWNEATAGNVTAGTFGAQLKTVLDTIAGYLDTEIAAIKAKTDQLTFTVANQVDATAIQLATQAKADVNAEVVDTLNVDTYSELTSLAGASPTIKQMMMFLYMIARNKVTTTSSQQKVYRDDASTVLGTWAVSDDGTTFTKGEVA